jgi:6-pyruvoyltetrahydropterin/6-carboxytetrahydropterin synthase
MTRLTRSYGFSASHRLHSEQLTEDENRALYGKCNNPFGHGHDYVLRVTVSGPVSDAWGRVICPGELDRFVQQRVIDVFDHRDMNTDVPGFEGVPTTENLATDIERRLRRDWEDSFASVALERIWLQETPRNTFELRNR